MPACKDCCAEGITTDRPIVKANRCATHHREVRKARRLAAHAAYTARTYSLTPGQYEALYEAQGGVCAICRRATGASKRLSVDHDHACCPGPTSCGRCIRGLLCAKDNQYIGHLRDDPDAGRRITDYLTNPPARFIIGGTP